MSNQKQLNDAIQKHKNKTPFYLCDKGIISEQIKKIQVAFSTYKNFELLYAIKANYSDIVLEEIKKTNIGVAVSSLNELKKVLQYNFKTISYTAPYISKEVLSLAIKNKVEINYNNFSDFQDSKIKNAGVRLNPEIGWSYFKDFSAGVIGSQFGISWKEALNLDLSQVTRLHMHTSSDSYNISFFIQGLKRLLKIAVKYPNISTINIGGGIATPIGRDEKEFDIKLYATEIIELIELFNKKHQRNLRIQIEPGNYIVRPSIYYVCKIQAMDKKNNSLCYYTDGTKHHLRGIFNIQKINFITKSKEKSKAKIFGCTCQRADVIYDDLEIPKLVVGDLAVIPMTGAYCLVQSDNFHLLDKPYEFSFN
ncbi:Diaminopimelate decarboxylase [sediment metagenome]|uniref:Diaminopimelate decarboxylase n=1 Tax=sediment metagenome TaxID=749907 RepID=D9PK12_9ZZZZ